MFYFTNVNFLSLFSAYIGRVHSFHRSCQEIDFFDVIMLNKYEQSVIVRIDHRMWDRKWKSITAVGKVFANFWSYTFFCVLLLIVYLLPRTTLHSQFGKIWKRPKRLRQSWNVHPGYCWQFRRLRRLQVHLLLYGLVCVLLLLSNTLRSFVPGYVKFNNKLFVQQYLLLNLYHLNPFLSRNLNIFTIRMTNL